MIYTIHLLFGFSALCSLASSCKTGIGISVKPLCSIHLDLHTLTSRRNTSSLDIVLKCIYNKTNKGNNIHKSKLIASNLTDFKILQCFCSEWIGGLINVELSSALSKCKTAAQQSTSLDICSHHSCHLRNNNFCLSQKP